MSTMLGTLVLYTLGNVDALEVNRRRDDWRRYVRSGALRDFTSATGYQAHVGNPVGAGDTFPAVVVAVRGEHLNLRVLLDGTDDLWAPSRTSGDPGHPGTWALPVTDPDEPIPYTLPYVAPAPDVPRKPARKAPAKKAAAG